MRLSAWKILRRPRRACELKGVKRHHRTSQELVRAYMLTAQGGRRTDKSATKGKHQRRPPACRRRFRVSILRGNSQSVVYSHDKITS